MISLKTDKLYLQLRFYFLLLALTMPFSFEWPVGYHKINIPTEPILGICAIYTTLILRHAHTEVLSIFRNRHGQVILFFVAWPFIATVFSTHPIVSLKSIIVHSLHFYVFFIGFTTLYKRDGISIVRPFFQLLGLSSMVLMIYIWIHHGLHNFRPDTAQIAALPFFRDHTHYGAYFAMLLPWFWFLKQDQRSGLGKKLGITGILATPLAIFLSFSRGSWLALLGTLTLLGILKSRFKLAIPALIISAVLVIPVVLSFETTISQRGSTIRSLTGTITHLRQDVSIAERENRYRCAFRMAAHRPLFGFGPGTFQFEYFSYQKPEEMTRISVTEPTEGVIGRGGSVHSDFLKALSETGVPGMISWLVLTGLVVLLAYRSNQAIQWVGSISAVTFIGLGIFNNFLSQEEVSMLFWISLAVMCSPLSIEVKAE